MNAYLPALKAKKMAEEQQHIDKLLEKLDLLLKRQDQFQVEINQLREDIFELRSTDKDAAFQKNLQADPLMSPPAVESVPEAPIPKAVEKPVPPKVSRKPEPPKEPFVPQKSWSSEKFIGENLINKVGIAITVIGVGVGAKYAIDNQLISPLTRIILGYLVALGLLGFAIRLKKDYEGFSAVLLSGAMTIMYFLTFMAYSFYDLIPQLLAFGMMVLFTLFTVIAALNYNRQVIALVGFAGAYAVPFLLSSGSGAYTTLFSYMAIINVGILLVAIRKYWTQLYYTAFALTWLIFLSWLFDTYNSGDHFGKGMAFSFIFFMIFYGTFLGYKFLKEEALGKIDTALLLLNSFLFYGVGYYMLEDHETGQHFLGLFTVANGFIHFVVSVAIYQKKLANRNLFFLVAGLVLVFLTLAVPVQLDGNWVTLIWLAEGALLFWIGRYKGVAFYEWLSYPLLGLASLSLVQDWGELSSASYFLAEENKIKPFFNIQFLTNLLFIAGFAVLNYWNRESVEKLVSKGQKEFQSFLKFALPGILLGVLYLSFFREITFYWDNVWRDSLINTEGTSYLGEIRDHDLRSFKSIWLVNYSMAFFTLLTFLNLKKIKRESLGWVALGLSVLALASFLTGGLFEISELRESYIDRANEEYFYRGPFHVLIRYVSLLFCGALVFGIYQKVKDKFAKIFEVALSLVILWITSSELITWMDFAGSEQSYKLGLSLLWGFYALLMVGIGIGKKQKYLRITGIAIFAITLVKLFAYDLSALSTISKTIVLVSLGVLLLIISFLYNKYQHLIGDENKN